MNLSLKNRRALVCGASQGIGAATAKALAEAGAHVTLVARTEEALNEVRKSLPCEGHEILAIDLRHRKELKEKIQAALQKGPFHILINNAGGPKSGALLDATDEDFLAAFETHILSAQLLAQLCVPGMKKDGFGRIINIISTSVKAPIANLGVSNTIRAAMANWSKTLSQEVGLFGITVNNLLPGFTNTPRLQQLKKAAATRLGVSESDVEKNWKDVTPTGRFSEPEELASAILFLASPAAGSINGINLPVDGGRTPSL